MQNESSETLLRHVILSTASISQPPTRSFGTKHNFLRRKHLWICNVRNTGFSSGRNNDCTDTNSNITHNLIQLSLFVACECDDQNVVFKPSAPLENCVVSFRLQTFI